MSKIDLQTASSSEVAKALRGVEVISAEDLRAALANAMERIASLESDRDELLQMVEVFNSQMKASKLYGAGVLDEQ